jgi:putative transposase
VTAFIDQNRGDFGVEPVCRALDVSASAYHHRKTGARSARRIEDERLSAVISDVYRKNYECYGVPPGSRGASEGRRERRS